MRHVTRRWLGIVALSSLCLVNVALKADACLKDCGTGEAVDFGNRECGSGDDLCFVTLCSNGGGSDGCTDNYVDDCSLGNEYPSCGEALPF